MNANQPSLLPVLIPMLLAFAFSAAFCPLFIPLLKKLKFGQQIRQEGNPEHYKKQGTPTMGGIAFLLAMLLAGVIGALIFPALLPALPVAVLMFAFAVIGFIDDYLKVVKKQSEGFKAWQKLLCQIVVSGVFAWYAYKTLGSTVKIPFFGEADFGWFYIPFVMITLLGTDNAVNYTDGIDGLCSSVTAVVALFLMGLSFSMGEGAGVPVLSGIVLGGLMGFLLSNSHPAKVFMGDTGALALGGFVAGAAVMMKMEWFIILFGAVYLMEMVSTMIQVAYFKLTHGKRFFKMTPIHHHFELSGFSETQIVTLFTVITIIGCVISIFAL